MNKRLSEKEGAEARLPNPLDSNREHPWATAVIVTAFLLTAVFYLTATSRAASSTETLQGNDSLNVQCDGRGFQVERVSRTTIKLICQGSSQPGDPVPPVEPTQPPVEPTQPPIDPTQPPIDPTESPAEPTAIPPVEPTSLPPVEPTSEPPVEPGTPLDRIIGSCGNLTGFTPINDLGGGTYFGYQGGLYPGGSNQPPADYLAHAMSRISNIGPNDPFVMLSIGMSNAMHEFEDFQSLAATTPNVNPNMTVINGAQTGQDSATIADPNAPLWSRVDSLLGQRRLDASDVRVIWLKQAHSRPELTFPNDANQLKDELNAILDIINTRYPNVEVIYLSSRIYAGYSDSDLSPEPFAYQSGFAVKWVIEEHMSDPNYAGPSLLWGPYMWADGTTPRSDGLTWACSDFKNDYIHPSPEGELKVANLLIDFFSTDSTAVWFRNQ